MKFFDIDKDSLKGEKWTPLVIQNEEVPDMLISNKGRFLKYVTEGLVQFIPFVSSGGKQCILYPFTTPNYLQKECYEVDELVVNSFSFANSKNTKSMCEHSTPEVENICQEMRTLLVLKGANCNVIWIESPKEHYVIFDGHDNEPVRFSKIDGYKIIAGLISSGSTIGLAQRSFQDYASMLAVSKIDDTWTFIGGYTDDPNSRHCCAFTISMENPIVTWNYNNFDNDLLNQVMQ